MKQKSEELIFALDLVRETAPLFNEYFGRPGATWKADNTPVTEADLQINDLIIRRISEAYPGDAVYGEESSRSTTSDRVWVVDPIDGTQAFETGIPACTVVLALIQGGKAKLAVVYDPILDNIYYAENGLGAYKNEQPIRCADKNELEKSYFATSSHMPDVCASVGTIHDRIESRKGKVFNLRSFTYTAMLVAEGKFVGAVLGVGRLYDIAAPALIVEEAGGTATDLSGNGLNYAEGSNGILVTNGHVHDQLTDVIGK